MSSTATGFRTHVPDPGRSVRPPDLDPPERDAVRAADGSPPVKRRSNAAEFPLLVLLALVLAFIIKTFLVQAFFIPSGSMEDTLAIGDRVLVEKVSLRFDEPERGDVVVFRRPGVPERQGNPLLEAARSFVEGLGLLQPDADIDLIKRIIGLPGETVEIQGGVVTVDGVPLTEPYVTYDDQRDMAPLLVPAGEYFLLGDNRPNSDDSRFSLGTVPRENIVGRAFVILWPPAHFETGLGSDY